MGHLDRAAATLAVKSNKTSADALRAAKAAVEGINAVGTTRVRVARESSNGFRVALKPTVVGALHGAGHFEVTAAAREGGSNVSVRFVDPVVVQQKFLGFIPAGPKTVMGIKAYERSLEAVRKAVA